MGETRAMKSKLLRLSLLGCALFAYAVRGAESAPRPPQSPLAEARARLEELQKQFTEDNPRIIEQKAKIAELERRPVTFSIDFPGGTISDFLDAVSNGKGVSLSIINAGDPADLATRLPEFSLRNTNLMTAIQVLSRLLEPRGFNLSMMPSDVNSVAVVLGRNEPARPRTPLPIDFESFQLAPYLRDQSIDDIVEAIRASWELNPRNDPNALRLKFHPPTSILLASGPRDALNMAGKIISQLKISHPDAQKTADAKAAADRARLEAVADTAKKQFEERQKMTEGRTKGGPSPGAATEKK
jgi:hypothetical protein